MCIGPMQWTSELTKGTSLDAATQYAETTTNLHGGWNRYTGLSAVIITTH